MQNFYLLLLGIVQRLYQHVLNIYLALIIIILSSDSDSIVNAQDFVA